MALPVPANAGPAGEAALPTAPAEIILRERPVDTVLDDPTYRYDYVILGDSIRRGTLRGYWPDGDVALEPVLPPDRVFEDVEVRLAPGDGPPDTIVVVEAQRDQGAQLVLYRFDTNVFYKLAATPPAWRRNRWLAFAAVADFDGDGANDIAYVETPHLDGILKIVTLRDRALVPIATAKPGYSNHRIGQDFITSDVRVCGGVTELLLPDLNWTTLMAARLEDGEIRSRPLPFDPSRDGIAAARLCGDR